MKLHLLAVCCVVIWGCVPRNFQEQGSWTIRGILSSGPSDAKVEVLDSSLTVRARGVTPYEYELVVNDPTEERLLLVKKPGYLDGGFSVSPMASGPLHCILKKDPLPDLQKEAKKYEPEYKKRCIEIIGLYDKALHSPQMLFASIMSEAKTESEKLKVEFPALKGNAAARYFEVMEDKFAKTYAAPAGNVILKLLLVQVMALIEAGRNAMTE